MKHIIIIIALASGLAAQSTVTIHRHDAQATSALTGLPATGGDFIQVSVIPQSKEVTSVKIVVRIQDDGNAIVFERSTEPTGRPVNWFIPVTSARRAVITSLKVTQRADIETREYVE